MKIALRAGIRSHAMGKRKGERPPPFLPPRSALPRLFIDEERESGRDDDDLGIGDQSRQTSAPIRRRKRKCNGRCYHQGGQ